MRQGRCRETQARPEKHHSISSLGRIERNASHSQAGQHARSLNSRTRARARHRLFFSFCPSRKAGLTCLRDAGRRCIAHAGKEALLQGRPALAVLCRKLRLLSRCRRLST